jgi:hypothetical protein
MDKWREREKIRSEAAERKAKLTIEVEGTRYKYDFTIGTVFKKEVSQEIRRKIKDICDAFIKELNEHDRAPS